MRILLDPGHGGSDVGAECFGLQEKDFNLEMCHILGAILTAAKHSVTMTRSEDVFLPLSARSKLPKRPFDLVLCVHADANGLPTVGDLGTYVRPDDFVGGKLAELIEVHAPKEVKPRVAAPKQVSADDWTYRARNCLIGHHPTPSVLLECGFLTKPAHAKFLGTTQGKIKIAMAVLSALGDPSFHYKGIT